MALVLRLVAVLFGIVAWFKRRKAAAAERSMGQASQRLAAAEEVFLGTPKNDRLKELMALNAVASATQAKDNAVAMFEDRQQRAKCWTNRTANLKGWQGRKLPYTLGA